MGGWSIPALGQSSGAGLASVLVWSGVLVAILLLAFFGYALFKRWMMSGEDSGVAQGGGFTFGDLRELHRQGKLSDQEYETARERMVASAKRLTESLPEPLAKRGKGTAGEGPGKTGV